MGRRKFGTTLLFFQRERERERDQLYLDQSEGNIPPKLILAFRYTYHYLILLIITYHNSSLLSYTQYYLIFPCTTWHRLVLLSITQYLALTSTQYYLVLLGITQYYFVIQCITQYYLHLLLGILTWCNLNQDELWRVCIPFDLTFRCFL